MDVVNKQQKKFEGQDVVIEMTREPNCIVRMDVSLGKNATEKCHKKAVKQVNKRISIPGFRKGKAPDGSVLERYPSQIEQEFKELVIQEAFESALKLSNIYPRSKESISRPQIQSCSIDEGSKILFSFEVFPDIPEIAFSEIKLSHVDKNPISEAQVDQVVDQIRNSYATYEEVAPRAVQEGDFVQLTIHAYFEDGQKHPVVTRRRFEVNNEMQSWLKELVLTMNVGEVKEGRTAPDPKLSEEEKSAFKEMVVEVELLGLLAIRLPELDDELAKKVGAQSKEDVLEKVRHNLDAQAIHEQREKQLNLLEEELVARYPIELPPSMVAEEKKERARARLAALKAQKLTAEELKIRQQELEEQLDQETARAIRLYFIREQIAKQGNLSLSQEELNQLLREEATRNPHLYDEQQNADDLRRRIQQLRYTAFQRKIEQYALSQVLERH